MGAAWARRLRSGFEMIPNVSTGRFRRTRGKPARPDGGVASDALWALLHDSLEHSLADGTGRREALGWVVEEELVEAELAVAGREVGERLDGGERRLRDPAVAVQERADDRSIRRTFEDGELGSRRAKPLLGREPVSAHRVPAVGALARRPRPQAGGFVVAIGAGADADLEPAAGDVVDGDRLLGEQGWLAEDDGADERADPDPARRLRERGERRPALVEGPRADRVHEVVGDPEAVEPELLHLARPADDLLPRLERDDDGAKPHAENHAALPD